MCIKYNRRFSPNLREWNQEEIKHNILLLMLRINCLSFNNLVLFYHAIVIIKLLRKES